MKKIWIPALILVFLFITWATTFLFVVPTNKAHTGGFTVWMFKPDRLLTDFPFVCTENTHVDSTGNLNTMKQIMILPFPRS